MAWRRSRRESGGGLEVAETTTRAVLHRAAVVVRTAVEVRREVEVWVEVEREREQLVCVFFRKILLLEPGLGGRGSWVCAGMVRGAERKRSAVTAC